MFTRFAYLVIAVVVGVGAIAFSQATRGHLVEATSVVTAPAQSAVDAPFGVVGDLFRNMRSVEELQKENAALQAEIDRLRQETVQLPELEHENQILREQANYRQSQPAESLLSARIIGRDPDPLVNAVTIDQGLSAGLSDGMVVVSPAGLVGRIERAGPSSSKVLLITSSASSVNCVDQASRARGVAEGGAAGSLVVRDVGQDEVVKVGDQVVTSGLGGSFPSGLLVGKVTDVQRSDAALVQEVAVAPSVDLEGLESVLVITNFQPSRLD